jgi:hypothetical protein
MRTLFKVVMGLSALFIAACGAYFSIRGLSALFIGSAVAVMVMASSLEIGKLVAASFLYRYWRQITVVLRVYLVLAVLVLMGITSLGIYGYLARAYETTSTRVSLLERQAQDLGRQVAEAQQQIDAGNNQVLKFSDADRADIQKEQQFLATANQSLEDSLRRLEQRRQSLGEKRDHDLEQQKQRLAESGEMYRANLAAEQQASVDLNGRLAVLDRAVDAYTREGGAGFLKADHIKRGQQLLAQQQPERDKIAREVAAHDATIAQLRAGFTSVNAGVETENQAIRKQCNDGLAELDKQESQLRSEHTAAVALAEAKLNQLRGSDQTVVSTGNDRIDAINQRVAAGNEEIDRLRREIAATDIGSYRFVARAFNAPVDDVVKWLILIMVLVFDPLAVTLTVGFNVALLQDRGRHSPVPQVPPVPAADATPVVPGGWWTGGVSPRARRLTVAALVLAVAVCLGLGVYGGAHYLRGHTAETHARLIPPESFAVATLRPAQLQDSAALAPLLTSLEGVVPDDLVRKLSELAGYGLNPRANVYVFLTYPPVHQDKAGAPPVLLLGLVAAVNDPAAAEAGLARWADSLAGVLLPKQPGHTATTRNRSMIRSGCGRYLDPEGGFFTFAVTDSAAIVMVELEGDPNHPCVEDQVRRCLATESGDGLGQEQVALPARATAGAGAAALWFDARRCFAQMPKNSAAQTRYQQLQRFLDFDLVLTLEPRRTGELLVTGDYHYTVDKFRSGERADLAATGAKAAAPGDGGVAGRLMDRCAQTLDFDALIARLRQTLAAGPGGATQVVVQKTVDSQRDARFVLQASFPSDGRPAHAVTTSYVAP